MTKLLKKYFAVQKKYRNNKMLEKFEDTCAWSKALNKELESILSKMDVQELNYLLNNTSGMFSVVIKKYLDEASPKNQTITKEDKSSDLAISVCV